MTIMKIYDFLLLLIPTVALAVDPLVLLPNGYIRGHVSVTLENKTFYSFEKVPYAAAPVGNLRFKPPQPAPNWTDVLNTTKIDVMCYQTNDDYPQESEDCLYANTNTSGKSSIFNKLLVLLLHRLKLPGDGTNVSLPVMFYIHGGGFIEGSSLGFPPDNFINYDVILVTINYRLGVFGFISTQDEVIPGNNGLKDQLLAIKWTHSIISLFGGDPDKITIFGESAGSASVSYQLLNQQNKNLFKGAILQSGSALSPWAFQRRAREIAFTTASFLNPAFNGSDNSTALAEYLQGVDARDLDKAARQYQVTESNPQDIEILQGFYWAPVVEVENPDAFITEKMYSLLESGNVVAVPILIGINSEEGLSFATDHAQFKIIMDAYDQHLDWVVPNDMGIEDNTNRTEMGQLIREMYTSGKPLGDNLGDGVRYYSDTSFTRSVIKNAELFSKVAPTYFYELTYDGELGHFDVHYDGAESVGHGEDYWYMFCSGDGCDLSGYPETDQIVQKRIMTIWTNFAKYQNPTPKPCEVLQNITWPKVATENGDLFYVDIGEDLQIKNHPKGNTYATWVGLYSSLGYSDFDTY